MSAVRFKPMLATDYDPEKLRFPCWASFKLDGVRAVIREGIVYSRSNKPIPNKYVQEKFKHLEHYDGELIVGDPCSKSCYRDTVSVVMSYEKLAHDVNFFIFDHIKDVDKPYAARCKNIRSWGVRSDIYVLDQHPISNLEELAEYEALALSSGYEGLILRDPAAHYKMGRSTVNEGILLKVKTFVDSEALVIGFEERMANNNAAVISELGRTKRSSHKAGKSGRDDLGALVCRSSEGITFSIGTGFSDSEREQIWKNRDAYLNRLAKFKHFPIGAKDSYRHPVFLGWRDLRDMS